MLFLTEQDLQKLQDLYKSWLNDALAYERCCKGSRTSCSAILSEVKEVKGKISRETVNAWLKGIPLSVPYVTYDIVSMSLSALSSLPLVLSHAEDCDNPLHIDNTYGKALLCHTFTSDDYDEFDAFYWGLLTDLIFEGAYNENR